MVWKRPRRPFAGGVVGELEVPGPEPRAFTRAGIDLAGVGDLERDLQRVAVHLERLLDVVAVAEPLAGFHVVLLQVQARGHVRRAGPHDVGFEALVVEVLGEPVLDAAGGLDALALDIRGPVVLVLHVGGHERAVRVRGGDDGGAILVVEGEQVTAELLGIEAAAGELVALGRDHGAILVQVARRVHGPHGPQAASDDRELAEEVERAGHHVGSRREDDAVMSVHSSLPSFLGLACLTGQR